MKRILRNTSRETVNTTYNGKKYVIKPKGTIILDHNGKDEQAADYLLQTYGFLQEVSIHAKVKKLPVRRSYGKRIKRRK